MINLGSVLARNCQGVSRREILQIGASSLLGLSLGDVLRADRSNRELDKPKSPVSCILIYLAGGPSQLETFDPKPQARVEIRGPWGAIPTKVPGTQISELLPMLAQSADRYALIRSLQHSNSLHTPWPMMSGNMQQATTYGAAFTYLNRATTGLMPPYVQLGASLTIGAGTLGAAYEPLVVANPAQREGLLPQLTLSREITPDRLQDRELLLREVDGFRRHVEEAAVIRNQESCHQRALELLTTAKVREAFDLSRETETLRDRYGANFFGQSCLMGRRLIESGTRFVQLMWYEREDGFASGWDVHGYDAPGLVRMEHQLCPRFDQGLSALLEDLGQRGMLDTTLVCVLGEFGRTPTFNKHGGRDHWPYCFSALLAGAGVPGGTVVGASDARAAYPADHPVNAPDFAATLYRLLGVDVNREDRLRSAIFEGSPIDELCPA